MGFGSKLQQHVDLEDFQQHFHISHLDNYKILITIDIVTLDCSYSNFKHALEANKLGQVPLSYTG